MTRPTARHVHFVGIGGVGMSAIAKVLIEQGVTVSGTDLKRSRALTTLEAMGAIVTVGHDAAAIGEADLVVVSTAIPETNPELTAARKSGLQIVSRGEALAAVLVGTESIVVAGTHGKTTTTSMIVSVLRDAGLDPTYLIGGGLNDAGTNAKSGRGRFSVAESDESDGSFLLLQPNMAVITNVEVDHVDFWGSLEELRKAFETFLASVPDGGTVIVPASDTELVETARNTGRALVTFGPDGDVRAESVEMSPEGMRFDLHVSTDRHPIDLKIPGDHNVMNALAAAAAASTAGVSIEEIATGLAAYRGVERRFHLRGVGNGVTVIDDYAHHPTEVRATLSAAKGRGNRVLAVFQPHRYSRTEAFATDFGAAFGDADVVVVTDVYGAGEAPVPGVTGKLIADAVCNRFPGRSVAYLPHRDELLQYLDRTARPGDVLLTLGAGDVTSLGEEFLARADQVA